MIANTTTIRTEPFLVQVDEADLEDLRERIARTRWTDAIPGAGWDYGVDLDWARRSPAPGEQTSTGARLKRRSMPGRNS